MHKVSGVTIRGQLGGEVNVIGMSIKQLRQPPPQAPPQGDPTVSLPNYPLVFSETKLHISLVLEGTTRCKFPPTDGPRKAESVSWFKSKAFAANGVKLR